LVVAKNEVSRLDVKGVGDLEQGLWLWLFCDASLDLRECGNADTSGFGYRRKVQPFAFARHANPVAYGDGGKNHAESLRHFVVSIVDKPIQHA